MRPPSYQAAPPRASTGKLNLRRADSRPPTPSRALACGVRDTRVGEPIQNLFLAAYHAEHFARDALLRRRIRAQLVLGAIERIHHALQRVDLAGHPRARLPLPEQIDRAELAAFDRED